MELAPRVPLTKKRRRKPPSRETLEALLCCFIATLSTLGSAWVLDQSDGIPSQAFALFALLFNAVAAVYSGRGFLRSWERDQED